MGEFIGSFLILVGAAFGALSGIGQVRFSDLMTRMHIATKPGTRGLLLVATGAMFHINSPGAITLTPGTLTIDARGRPALLYVHVLSFTDEASAVADVEDLERRAVRAFGTAEDVARVCGTPVVLDGAPASLDGADSADSANGADGSIGADGEEAP